MSHPCRLKRRSVAEELVRFVQEGNTRRVERALAGGADIDGRNANLAFPPLVLAAQCGGVKMAKFLLRRGADVDVATPHHVPCGCSKDNCARNRLFTGSTALHVAIYHRRLDVLRLLLRSGGNTNLVNSRGFTPLHLACDKDAEADAMVMTTALLDGGADPLLGDTKGRLAVHFAAGKGHTDVLDMLLLKAPATLNTPDSDDCTPLCFAAAYGREAMVLHLLQLGAKQPVAADNEIASPLAAAVEFGHDGILRILLDHGMEAVGSTESIGSAVESAARKGRARSLGMLLGHFDGDDDTRRTHFARWSEDGFPVLHIAVVHGRLATVSVLLAAGADETALDRDGKLASEVVGSEDGIDPATETAIVRMLERGPAIRAASWRWRASMSLPSDGAGGNIVAFPGGRHVGPFGVKIFRPTRRNAFVRFMRRTVKELQGETSPASSSR